MSASCWLPAAKPARRWLLVRVAARAKRQAFTEEDLGQLDPKLLKECAENKWKAIETFFKISNKNGDLVPCKIPSLIQRHFDASGEVALFLKGRQQYLTSSADAYMFEDMISGDGLKVLALNLTDKKAAANFKRVLDFDQHRHAALKELTHSFKDSEGLGYNESRGMFRSATIKNDSTAEQAELVARSETYQRARWTEAAYSRHYLVVKKALLDTMPRQNRKLIIETTGNGAQGGFYLDFIEVVTNGKPHPHIPNCWVMGKVTAHFLAWFQHDEYLQDASTCDPNSLAPHVRDILLNNEKEHVEEMQKAGLKPDEIRRRLNWARAVLMGEKNLLTDPEGAVKNFNREYPGNYRHAFQATGTSWFSLNRIDSLREFWKKENEMRKLPLRLDLLREENKAPQPVPGKNLLVWDLPEKGYKNRYLGALDVASGNEDSDKAAGGILDRFLLKWVAIFHGAYTPTEAAAMLYDLGVWYDMALLNWENNSLGLGVTEYLLDENHTYPNLYREDKDRFGVTDYGWLTGPESRRLMVGEGKVLFEHPRSMLAMPYIPFYGEAAAFQCPPGKSRPEAVAPSHDDIVMMYCIGAVTHKLMDPVQIINPVRTAGPGQTSIHSLSGYRAAAKARRANTSAGHKAW
jgi:hypothetical protein